MCRQSVRPYPALASLVRLFRARPEGEALTLIERSERVAHTPHTRTDVAEIVATLREARQRGYAINCEELFHGDMTLAAL
ncbi:Transcriptional regulator, IclR family [Cupriavidus necator H850]|nr:Transcriptional regulator, IclR family [Cupriavidus necator H850]